MVSDKLEHSHAGFLKSRLQLIDWSKVLFSTLLTLTTSYRQKTGNADRFWLVSYNGGENSACLTSVGMPRKECVSLLMKVTTGY